MRDDAVKIVRYEHDRGLREVLRERSAAHITAPEAASARENRCAGNEVCDSPTRQADAFMVVLNDPEHVIEQLLDDTLGESLPEHEIGVLRLRRPTEGRLRSG